SHCMYTTNSECKFTNDMHRWKHNTYSNTISRWRNLFMVAGRSNNTNNYCFTCINDNLYSYIYFWWMFQYRKRNSNSKCSTNSKCKLTSNMHRRKCNTHSNTISNWRNIFMVTGWTNNSKHYSITCINNNLYSYIYIGGMFQYRKRNSNR